MVKFRQKTFAKRISFRGVGKYVKDHPALALSGTSIGIAGSNLAVNAKRTKEAKEYQEEQLKAMRDLTKSLGKVDKSLQEASHAVEVKEDNPVKNLGKRLKVFSIESGGYKGGKREAGNASYLPGTAVGLGLGAAAGGMMAQGKNTVTGAVIGGIIGSGLGALYTWLHNLADKSLFNSDQSRAANSYKLIDAIEKSYAPSYSESESTSSTTTTDDSGKTHTKTTRVMRTNDYTKPKGIVYDVDGDPNKYIVSVLYTGNVLMMYVNRPTPQEIRLLDKLLDGYCYSFRKADYIAEQISKNVYVVEVNVVANTETYIAQSIIASGIKINILTGNKFGVKNR